MDWIVSHHLYSPSHVGAEGDLLLDKIEFESTSCRTNNKEAAGGFPLLGPLERFGPMTIMTTLNRSEGKGFDQTVFASSLAQRLYNQLASSSLDILTHSALRRFDSQQPKPSLIPNHTNTHNPYLHPNPKPTNSNIHNGPRIRKARQHQHYRYHDRYYPLDHRRYSCRRIRSRLWNRVQQLPRGQRCWEDW